MSLKLPTAHHNSSLILRTTPRPLFPLTERTLGRGYPLRIYFLYGEQRGNLSLIVVAMSYMQMRLELDGRDECRPFEAGFGAPLLPVCGQFVAEPVVAAGIGA